jgi:hypothetical protein
MKEKLITYIQQAIVLYAIKKNFWQKNKDNFKYEIEEINKNRSISKHIKKYILYINDILLDDSIKTDIELAEKIYSYLKNIRTGFDLFGIIQIRTPIYFCTTIYHAMFNYDAELFEACKMGTTTQLTLTRNKETPQKDLYHVEKMSQREMKLNYHRLLAENETLKTQLHENEAALLLAQEEQRVLLEQLGASLATNKIFREKIKEMITSHVDFKHEPTTIPTTELAH